MPLIGGVAMLAVFIYGLTKQAAQVSWVAGAIVVGCVVVAIVVRLFSHVPYFSQRAVHEVQAEAEIAPS